MTVAFKQITQAQKASIVQCIVQRIHPYQELVYTSSGLDFRTE